MYADEMDILAGLFGFKLTGETIEVYVNDDGWYTKKMSFHKNHMPSFLQATHSMFSLLKFER